MHSRLSKNLLNKSKSMDGTFVGGPEYVFLEILASGA